jgi:hypothetical protein
MPELDFMIMADYVRAEGGVLHMIAAGIDTIFTPVTPAVRQIGIGIRLTMTLEVVYQNEDGVRIAQINAGFAPPPDPSALPPGVRPAIAIPFNMSLPLPAYGRYSLELLVDGNSLKSIGITVSQPPEVLPGIPGHA